MAPPPPLACFSPVSAGFSTVSADGGGGGAAGDGVCGVAAAAASNFARLATSFAIGLDTPDHATNLYWESSPSRQATTLWNDRLQCCTPAVSSATAR
eukprot:gene3234-biopygen4642